MESDSRVAAEGGFALVAVLLTLVALTALATGGFFISNTDYKLSQNHTAGIRAFHVADAAMYDHMGTNRRGHNSVTYTYASGAATVAGDTLLDLGDGNMLFRITSRSTHLPAEGGMAARTVSLIAMTHDGSLKAKSALTAASGITKSGGSGTLDGNDEALAADCTPGPQPAVAGVETYPGGYTQTGGSPVPTGNPPVEDSQSGYDLLVDLGLDWAGILAGTVMTPDFVMPGDAWPNYNTMDPDWWPVTFMDQANATVGPTQSGRGTLIVKGNLDMNGAFTWEGILLVGGAIFDNGNSTVTGTAVAGLNELLGQFVPTSTIANGTKKFVYNSCWVRYAAQQFGPLIEVPGTWSESW